MTGLPILIDYCPQRAAVIARSGGEGQLGSGIRRDAQMSCHRAGWVESRIESDCRVQRCGVRRHRGIVKCGHRLTARTITPQPTLTIRLDAYADQLRIALCNEMRCLQTALGSESRRAFEQQRLMMWQPMPAYEETSERRMRFIGARVS